jgi:hypothetical protein
MEDKHRLQAAAGLLIWSQPTTIDTSKPAQQAAWAPDRASAGISATTMAEAAVQVAAAAQAGLAVPMATIAAFWKEFSLDARRAKLDEVGLYNRTLI